MDAIFKVRISTAVSESATIRELNQKAAEVNEVAYELLEDIETEWLQKHKPRNKNSFSEMYKLRTEARLIAEEVVLHDVVNCFH